MEEGISVDEACARNVIGTQEDFDKTCNPDGIVKDRTGSITVNSESSTSFSKTDNGYLLAGLVFAVVTILVLIVIALTRKTK